MNITNLIHALPWHTARKWASRDTSEINKIVIHQELAEGTIEQVNHYHIQPNHLSDRGCPHFCYHYGIRKNGEVIQANSMNSITWHVGNQNRYSVGIMLVGNFPGPGYNLSDKEPTKEQMLSLHELVSYLIAQLNLSKQDVYGHYHFGKPACPGYVVQEWIENLRNSLDESDQVQHMEMTIEHVQKILNQLGYAAGDEDGIIGINTIRAIRQFQGDHQLLVDGVVGPSTWKNLLLAYNYKQNGAGKRKVHA